MNFEKNLLKNITETNESDLEAMLKEIDQLLEEMEETWPKELFEKWNNYTEDKLTDAEGLEVKERQLIYSGVIKKLNDLIDRRIKSNSNESARNRLSAREDIIKWEEMEGKKVALVDLIKEVLARKDNLIGEGKTAEVKDSSINPGLCIKIITNFGDEYSKYNDVHEEAKFLEKLVDLEVRGVKVPKVIYSITFEGVHAIILEKLDAVTLDECLSGKESFPENFNLEDFFQSLKEFIIAMHEDKKIYHWDLHVGNIMIDKKTGKPRIIDFGKSTLEKIRIGEGDQSLRDPLNQGNLIYKKSDLSRVDEARVAVLKHLRQEANH